MVYAYCRKPTGKDRNQYLSKVQQWAKNNHIQIDEFVWDDVVIKKTPFEKRNLGNYLLPKLHDGDWLIISQLSCIGRSASELDRFFNHALNGKNIHVVCDTIGLNIDFLCLSDKDRFLLDKITFAARLQRQLVHETTIASLDAKRASGGKLGAASKKWQESYEKKSKEQLKEENRKRGHAKNRRHFESADVQAFINIIKSLFPYACVPEDMNNWSWKDINTKGQNRLRLLSMMREYKEKDSSLFSKWNLSNDLTDKYLQVKLASYICSLRHSVKSLSSYKDSANILSFNDTQTVIPIDKTLEQSIDKTKLERVEEDTKTSQQILSNIFTDSTTEENEFTMVPISVKEIMFILLSKDTWTYDEVDFICKQRNQITGSVLEQINDYAFSVINDSIIDDDGEVIYVATEYKKQLT